MNIFSWFFTLLLQWYVWLPLVAVLCYLAWRNYRMAEHISDIQSTLLILEIPKANDKKELAAEQMFASLHGILRDKKELRITGGMQEHISFEIAAIGKLIRFYVWVPKHLQNFVEGQIYAQYPTVQIREADDDYTQRRFEHPVIHTAELQLIDNDALPIKTFQSFEVDPLAGITATLAKLEDASEEVWIQVLARPIADDWHRRASAYAASVKSGKSDLLSGVGGYLLKALTALVTPPTESTPAAAKELSERDKTRISEVEKKSTKLGYQFKIRIAYLGSDESIAKLRMQAIVGTFKQFNSTNLNGFRMGNPSFSREEVDKYAARFFLDRGAILNIEELASVFHLPHTSVETPSIVWATSKTAEPPAKLPILTGDDAIDENISAFGLTNFRGINHQFGLHRSDRSRHVYIIGQTGTGKSGLLELFALSDVFHNQGYAIIDPHGDLAVDNMRFVPAHRMKDVVYFNPADTGFPLGFNPMEVTDPNMKNNISSEIIGVLKRMFGESWGPRLEYILRYTILALLDKPGSTMLDITRMLTDKKFREEVLGYCTDTVVLNFWRIEFASWNDKFAAEAVAPVLNKVGAFVANPIIRNIIGQPKSTFNIRRIMDEGKILIVNLSKGLIGEDNASILGSFLVTKIQLAAMSRSDIPRIEDRRPFYLYVDEFQNFATDSFATILSEARKYGLNLTVANQYVSQMSETVRDAVFGNVGSMVTFRISADDAPLLAKQFEPQFESADLLQMHNRHFIITMVINGEKAPAFSATTLVLPGPQTDYTPHIIENNRQTYGRPRAEVEAEIQAVIGQSRPAAPFPSGGKPASYPRSPQEISRGTSQPPRNQDKPASHAQPLRPTSAPKDTTPASPTQPQTEGEGSSRKRKRSRSRSKKPDGGAGEGGQQHRDNRLSDEPRRQPDQRDNSRDERRSQQRADRGPRTEAQSAPAAPKPPRSTGDDHELRLR